MRILLAGWADIGDHRRRTSGGLNTWGPVKVNVTWVLSASHALSAGLLHNAIYDQHEYMVVERKRLFSLANLLLLVLVRPSGAIQDMIQPSTHVGFIPVNEMDKRRELKE